MALILALIKVFYETVKSLCLFAVPHRFRYKDVSKETVLITGGGSGIGRILAQKFAAQGSKVVIMDLNEAGMKETASLIKKSGGSCVFYVCDVSSRQNVYTIAAKIKEEIGFVTIVINNAGITGSADKFCDLNDERTITTMKVNALSHFWVTKAFLPEMLKQNHGHVVFVSSYVGLVGGYKMVDYSASKFAVMGLAESLTLEIRGDGYTGVHTTTVCPYLINTGLFHGVSGMRFVSSMTPEWASGRIFEAIRLNQPILVIPQRLYWTLFMKSFLPIAASFELYKALDGLTFMKGFTGRQQQMARINNNITDKRISANGKDSKQE